jgi:hypothetical protein
VKEGSRSVDDARRTKCALAGSEHDGTPCFSLEEIIGTEPALGSPSDNYHDKGWCTGLSGMLSTKSSVAFPTSDVGFSKNA